MDWNVYGKTIDGWILLESDYVGGGCAVVHLTKNKEGKYCDKEYQKHIVERDEETGVYHCSCGATRKQTKNLPRYSMNDSR